jgi:hypothetical protein
MFYALLILPHLLALIGLALFAYWSSAAEPGDDDQGGWPGRPGEDPPPGPEPGPGLAGPPLVGAAPPRRRLRVGERLSELHPRRSRREREPQQPTAPRLKR